MEFLVQVRFQDFILLNLFLPPFPNTLHNEFLPSNELSNISGHVRMKLQGEERTKKRSQAIITEERKKERWDGNSMHIQFACCFWAGK